MPEVLLPSDCCPEKERLDVCVGSLDAFLVLGISAFWLWLLLLFLFK